ncbi:Glucose-1-phosphate thymidylyltransferase [subsurface metagenome]
MKAIILAGGYAKRLWPLTKNKPKQLLSVGGKPMIGYIIEKLEAQEEIDKIIISTNEKFGKNFKEWLLEYKSIKDISLVIEPTLLEENKLGSVGALGYLIKKKNIDEELMIIGGDNLFEFDLRDLIYYYREKKGNVVALYDLKSIQKARSYGVAKVDEKMSIIDFVEKPENPPSTLVSTACYMLSPEGVRSILTYLDKGENPDAIGFFIKWLIKREKVFGFVFSGRWFDIGSLESLKEADLIYSKNKEEDL